jgi:hypothetical protein
LDGLGDFALIFDWQLLFHPLEFALALLPVFSCLNNNGRKFTKLCSRMNAVHVCCRSCTAATQRLVSPAAWAPSKHTRRRGTRHVGSRAIKARLEKRASPPSISRRERGAWQYSCSDLAEHMPSSCRCFRHHHAEACSSSTRNSAPQHRAGRAPKKTCSTETG